jgi:hypothetical protein
MRTTKTPRSSETSSRRSTRALLDRTLAAIVALDSAPTSASLIAAAREATTAYGAAAGRHVDDGWIDAFASLSALTGRSRNDDPAADLDSPYDADRYLHDARELIPLSGLLLAVDTLASSTGLRDVVEAEIRMVKRLPSVRTATGGSPNLDAYTREAVGAVVALGRILDDRRKPAAAVVGFEALIMTDLFADPAAATFLRVNRYEGIAWFNRERFGDVVELLALQWALRSFRIGTYETHAPQILEAVRRWIAGRNISGYRVDALLDALAGPTVLTGEKRSSTP